MTFTLIIPVLAGWLAGLIINYLADVLPSTRSLSQPTCRTCNEKIDIKNYLLLRACSQGHTRNIRTWVTQFIMVIASLYIWISPPHKLGYLLGLLIAIYFGIVLVIDLEHRLILHMTSLFGSLIALITGYMAHGLLPTLKGALGGLAIMLFFYYLGVLFTRFRARKMKAEGQEVDDEEALGAGDVILVTILGLMLGWPLIWFGLLVGILLGGFISLLLVVWLIGSRQYGKNALMLFIPYGPYFIISASLIIFFPEWLAKLVPN